MAVSKRLRFEIPRRDNHTCRYCGAAPPGVRLVVDHVVPETLGGRTEPPNLVTSCESCNSGKSSVQPDSSLVADVAEDALRWAQAMHMAAERMLADQARQTERQEEFLSHWRGYHLSGNEPVPLPQEWRNSVDRFVAAGLPTPVLLACVDKAMGARKVRNDDVFRYMCGIAWGKVTQLQEEARRALVTPDVEEEEEGEGDLVEYLLGDATPAELSRWSHNTDGDRQMTAIAGLDELRYDQWRLVDTLEMLLEVFPEREISDLRERVRGEFEEKLPDQHSDMDVLVATARQYAEMHRPRSASGTGPPGLDGGR